MRRLDPTLSLHDESMGRVVNGDNDLGFWDGKRTAAMKTQRFSGSPYSQSQLILDAGSNMCKLMDHDRHDGPSNSCLKHAH